MEQSGKHICVFEFINCASAAMCNPFGYPTQSSDLSLQQLSHSQESLFTTQSNTEGSCQIHQGEVLNARHPRKKLVSRNLKSFVLIVDTYILHSQKLPILCHIRADWKEWAYTDGSCRFIKENKRKVQAHTTLLPLLPT